eukprot:TRINITY_DN38030_c0_g2_i1.p1 TRINITY_DN38030_c0_g2~~TRINITY_DN38030_c0_g2_i1.p1  ORF type:complete len:210 (+),score=55.28 TRINITY_DN38030_c0_g2_i1:69-698(+)
MATGGVAPPAGAAVPPPQVVGHGGGSSDPSVDLRNQMAAAAARQGANQAMDATKHGIFEVKAYIQENPTSVKVFCFMTGLILIVFSLLGCFNIFGGIVAPRQYLTNVYNVIFGLIICICDGKESWMKSCFDVQSKLFQYAFFLATQTGRALFYLYVGTMTLLVLPDSWFWSLLYIIIGGVLCLLAILMLIIQWCGGLCGCSKRYSQDVG